MSWITGPHHRDRRTPVQVDEPDTGVFFHNGAAHSARTAGKHGGWLRVFGECSLPVSGNIAYLTFQGHPRQMEFDLPRVEVADGFRLGVTVSVQVAPRWSTAPELAMEKAKEFGLGGVASINANIDAEVEADIASFLRASLAKMTYDDIHSVPDPRMLLRVGGTVGLASVRQVNKLTITRDPVRERHLDSQREAWLARETQQAKQAAVQMRHAIQALEARLAARMAAEGAWIREISDAERHQVLAAMYQMSVREIRDPAAVARAREGNQRVIGEVLTRSPYLLGLLAELGGDPVEQLGRIVRQLDAEDVTPPAHRPGPAFPGAPGAVDPGLTGRPPAGVDSAPPSRPPVASSWGYDEAAAANAVAGLGLDATLVEGAARHGGVTVALVRAGAVSAPGVVAGLEGSIVVAAPSHPPHGVDDARRTTEALLDLVSQLAAIQLRFSRTTEDGVETYTLAEFQPIPDLVPRLSSEHASSALRACAALVGTGSGLRLRLPA